MADGQLLFAPELDRNSDPVWDKVKDHVTPDGVARCTRPLIAEINRLKRRETRSSWPTTT